MRFAAFIVAVMASQAFGQGGGYTNPYPRPGPGAQQDQITAWFQINAVAGRFNTIIHWDQGIQTPFGYLPGYTTDWLDGVIDNDPVKGDITRWTGFLASFNDSEAEATWEAHRFEYEVEYFDHWVEADIDFGNACWHYGQGNYFNCQVLLDQADDHLGDCQERWLEWENLLNGEQRWVWGFYATIHP